MNGENTIIENGQYQYTSNAFEPTNYKMTLYMYYEIIFIRFVPSINRNDLEHFKSQKYIAVETIIILTSWLTLKIKRENMLDIYYLYLLTRVSF